MYETQFGLNKRPFRALATGSDVFVGPQTAAAMAGLKKALATPDAIVTVSGPVGVGKTTIVRRALDAIGDDQVVISVGRVQLGHDEVLELLLEELGVEMPSGTVQRFTTFRRQLKQYADEGTRVFIIVEDAARVGAEALAELEALTASDAGVSEGANIVLMGDNGLDEVMKSPKLARAKQRLRLRQTIAPLGASELLGYFKHCFRLAGNEFDTIFEDGAAEVLHRLSEGIPRIANNLVESSLVSAADNKLDRVNVAQIKLVASEEYGLDISADPAPAEPEAPAPAVEPEPAPQAEVLGVLKPAPEPQAAPEPEPAPEPSPVAEEAEDEIPELIQDTLPDLEVLAPALAKPAAAPQSPQTPEPPKKPEPPSVDLEGAQVEAPAKDEVPEWERDPTLAQLRPDLDALEHAMAVAQGTTEDAQKKPEEPAEPVPEITLDRQIQKKVDKAEAARAEEERKRLEREAEKAADNNPLLDDRPTAEILADVKAKGEQRKDGSVESQFESAMQAAAAPEVPDLSHLNDSTDTIADLPILSDATTPAFEPAAHKDPDPVVPDPVVEADPEPTLPELTPELVAEPAPIPEPQPEPEPEPEVLVPDLALELDPEPEAAPAPAEVLQTEPDPVELENARKADAELEQIAVNLARAKTIDDCDDKMAETLFGEEFSMMAAQVAANAPADLTAIDEEEPAPAVPDFDGAAAVSVELETNGAPMDSSASQRLATVRALNTPDSPAPAEAAMPVASVEPPAPPPPTNQPESIEDQINTSMTQTLQNLSVRPPENDDEDDKSKGGFFSRFKRS